MADFVSLQEIAIAAKGRMSPQAWDYLTGGSDSETTLKRNRYAIDSIAFRPRVLVDVCKVDTAASFLNFPLRIPVMLAPIGSLQVFVPEGAVAVARAAAEFGTIPVVSTATQPLSPRT